ncbi:CO-methylating acetyl-CoA synthase corrinoid iron-sulfur protein large subunit precursor [Sporobacter termitidis DSM 10068]|uniref:CO-methylating acetyl-CoA synthase corrinoid iron-sulfur protein large subunit n=1 Tax=Sporobacter termitidis DSM 10068 TaxID=1123282 RepID=A0A1M5Z252_9FIRM|nr:acetyl-CoA decarbonylase/synthase complex subunit gamma [Sporobacter termitidis]SHI18310.1 CO-methylating acetyl-CoA synthase corrinoid iron-sulfur protein large subunit precursor [Sporobacter termitidis DSM 10068]
MALKGLDIFKLTPKTNCKDCGNPTCMAFAMKVAQGAVSIDKCPHMSADALAKLSEATEPPMKTISIGEHKLGGETVMLRHEKTLVNKNLFSLYVCADMADADIDAKIAEAVKVDYERISERMYVETIFVNVEETQTADRGIAVAKKAAATGRDLILRCTKPELAKEIAAAVPVKVLVGANASNYEALNAVATEKGLVLGVSGKDLGELHDTIEKLEAAGNKNLIIYLGGTSIKEAFAAAVQIRRAALKDEDRTFGYPAIVNLERLAPGDDNLQASLASLFTLRYGSILVMGRMTYADALPLYGLRQNIFTDPQKPMKVEPGIYPINGAGENAVCAVTVDFALTYFVVSGEMERSGVPVNLLISDAGGYSVLTSWAAGKFSAGSIAKFIEEQQIESKIKSRTLILPGKVAVLKGEVEAKLPGWNIVVGPNEAIQLVRFLKDYK